MKSNPYKLMINSCWAILIIYSIIKVLGGNWFELMCSSETFIAISSYIDNHILLKKIVACINSLFTGYFVLCAILKQKHLKVYHILVFIPLLIFKSFIQWDYNIIGLILDIVIIILLPIIMLRNEKIIVRIFRPIVGYILIFLFQLFSMFLADIALFTFNNTGTLENLLYSLEYFFCIILYYLYTIKKIKTEGGK